MKTIGIIGGGQLGLMIIEQAHLLGARTVCLDPAADAPAFALSDERIVAAYDDPAALEELCRRSDAVTYEFENVPGSVLIPLEKRYNIPQGFRPLFDSQDRLREKDNARAGGLATPEYAAADDEASLRAAVAKIGLPAVLNMGDLEKMNASDCCFARKVDVDSELGRALLDGVKEVRLFGEDIAVNAEIAVLHGTSGHADQKGLLNWVEAFEKKPETIFVNHGDTEACEAFQALLQEKGYVAVAPFSGAEFDLVSGKFLAFPEGCPIAKRGAARKKGVFDALIAAAQRLLLVAQSCKERPNRDLTRFTAQIQALIDRWEK